MGKPDLLKLTGLNTIRIIIIILAMIIAGFATLQMLPTVALKVDFMCKNDDEIDHRISPDDVKDITSRLLALGLDESGVLGSTGIDTHIQRVCNQVITLDMLSQYVDNLEKVSMISLAYVESLPIDFWDVRSREMRRDNLTEYEFIGMLVNQQEDYIGLLAQSYERFYRFQTDSDADTALDTVLDILEYVVMYYTNGDIEFVGSDPRIEIIRTWQQIIGHEMRINPLTDEPIIPITQLTRLNVSEMWRFHIGRDRMIGDIWGVSGFDDRFVGNVKNNNQVEHLVLTIALQYVYDNSVFILNAFEVQDTLSGGQTEDMGVADQNINNLIAAEFIPRYEDDIYSSIDYLRCILSFNDQNSQVCEVN